MYAHVDGHTFEEMENRIERTMVLREAFSDSDVKLDRTENVKLGTVLIKHFK